MADSDSGRELGNFINERLDHLVVVELLKHPAESAELRVIITQN